MPGPLSHGVRAAARPLAAAGNRDPLRDAIGVVYDPRAERWGNYVPTIVPRRYDAFCYVDETRALDPLHMPVLVDGEVPETYPSGM